MKEINFQFTSIKFLATNGKIHDEMVEVINNGKSFRIIFLQNSMKNIK
jgi:hypothetical protein